VSDYRPSDFKQKNSSRQLGTMVDTHLADQLAEITAARGTSLSVELRRATREYVERELLKVKAERETA
jgi:hypothetical protein